MKKPIRLLSVFAVLILLAAAGCSTFHLTEGSAYKKKRAGTEPEYKNVIVMVPDGCSMSIETFARLYKGSDINLDKLHTGSVRTFSANSVITDSAAAATAFATGHKTTTGFLGVGPDTKNILSIYKPKSSPYHPLPSILEGAKYNGKSTGLVVTSVVNHATPGGFSAHVPSRNNSDDIMEQIVYQDIDVIFGGGGSNLLPSGTEYKSASGDIWKGTRKDSENLINILQERGYSFISSSDELNSIKNDRVWGVFNKGNLVPDIDRDELNPSQPSLAQMTGKAIEILSKNKNGFFMMVEGSQVDYAGHANDPVFMVSEFLAFDEAVGVAVDYAKKNGNTLIVIFPDHDTGGLSIGNTSELGRNYSSTPIDTLVAPFKNAQITVQGLLELAYKDNNATIEEIKELFNTKWKLSLDDTQAAEILKFRKSAYGVANYLSNNFSIIGWTTGGHTGVDVPLWIYPNEGDGYIRGNIDNTQIAVELAKIMEFDLTKIGEELFVEAGSVFPEYRISNDDTGYILETGDIRIPVNKDIVYKEGREFRTKGITVYAPNINKVFIPREAVKIIQGK